MERGLSILEWSQLAANIATTLGVAGVALAYVQLRAGAKAQKMTTAVVAWNDYLRLALEHPRLARPAVWLTDQGRDSADFGAYRWFVAFMFFACEQVLEAHPGDPAWEAIVKSQVRYHTGFLLLPEFDSDVYSRVLGRICSEVRAEANRSD